MSDTITNTIKPLINNAESCWMLKHCPYSDAVCMVSQPEDDGCYVYRKFKEIFKKQGLLKDD